MSMKHIRLAILSAGLGRVHRGFEVSASRLFNSLTGKASFDVRLFCGGSYPSGTHVRNIPRSGIFATLLKRMGLIQDGCRLEQISFAVGFLPSLLAWKPDV